MSPSRKCKTCGRQHTGQLKSCAACRARRRERYQRNKAAGLCVNCGSESVAALPGRTLCGRCAATVLRNTLSRKAQWKRAGLCVDCGRSRGDDGTAQHCRGHADRHAANMKLARERRVAAGKCLRCGEDAVPGVQHCEQCRRLVNWRQRRKAQERTARP